MNKANIVIKNAKVITLNQDDLIANSIAIAGTHIAAIGVADEISPHDQVDAEIIDAGGRTVIPGLIDGHAHMDREGLKKIPP